MTEGEDIGYFEPDPDRTLVWGEHDLKAMLDGDVEVDPLNVELPRVEIFGFFVYCDGRNVTVQNDGYARPVAQFDPGTYDDERSFISDAYGWRLELNMMDRDEKIERFQAITRDPEKKDHENYVYVPE